MGSDDQQPSGEDDAVRLIRRSEAEDALRKGEAVGRRSLATPSEGAEPTESGLPIRGSEPIAPFPRPSSQDVPTEALPVTPRPIGPSRSIAAAFGAPPEPPRPRTFADEQRERADGSERHPERSPGVTSEDIREEVALTESLDPVIEDEHSAIDAADGDAPAIKGKNVRGGRRFKPSGSSRAALLAGTIPGGAETVERVSTTFRSASMKARLLTAACFAVTAVFAFWLGPVATLVMAVIVITMCAVELFDGFRRVGFRPATLLGLAATFGVMIGAYVRGEAALPTILILLTVFTFLWYLCGVSKAPATMNTAVTLLGFVWVGIFGAYAALLLRMPDREGLAFFIGAVLITMAYDTGAYFGGSTIGRHVMAPAVSPNKTWEGLVTGTLAALLIGGAVVSLIHPWGIWSGLALAAVISVIAPLGDLAESMIKRDLGVKDMGRILPGHGGLFDRFDAMLFALPATYYLVHILGLV